uniref:ubiquitinyl hydrolase 1 n=1 Tax=viral metagenome TaxID=1070528 RepID=A0A6C0AS39_9ZZZZ
MSTPKNPPINLTKYHNKGLVGIENLGNTCFVSACIQVLGHVYELNEFLDSEKYQKLTKKSAQDVSILNEYDDLRKVMWSGNGIVTPRKFIINVKNIAMAKGRELFTGYAQNDLPEFLLFMMDCMHNSISRCVNMKISGNVENSLDNLAVTCYTMLKDTYQKEYSEIMDLFYGVYVSEITSKDGQVRHSIKPENYFMLDLPLAQKPDTKPSLYDCLDLFIAPEYLEGDNAWFNEKTNQKEDISKQMLFWNFPKILVIALKRFTPDGLYKDNSLIDFPLTDLDLAKYVRGYNQTSFKYDLFGICNHLGGTDGGHYTAFVKNAQEQWHHYDDRNIESVANPQDMISPSAYCLFYRKKNNLV